MNLSEEYELSREYVAKDFSMNGKWSLFEVLIRWVGGFVSLYDMTGDELYKSRSQFIVNSVLHFFNENGYYKSPIDIIQQPDHQILVRQMSGTYLISEIGSYQLEFLGLSRITGDPRYMELCLKAFRHFWDVFPNQAIPPGYDPERSNSGKRYIGAMTDSYYEYVIKVYLMTGGENKVILNRHLMMMNEIKREFLLKTGKSNLTVIGQVNHGRQDPIQEHLGTFLAGTIALGSIIENPQREEDLRIAGELADQYAFVYKTHRNKVMSEVLTFITNKNAKEDYYSNNGDYMLRPESVESIFYLWRFTGEQKYRDYAWEIFKGINETCRVELGFSAIDGANSEKRFKNSMPSFFFAETLKYLYLTFSDSSLIGLNDWIFNTEAHPIKYFSKSEVEKWKAKIDKILGTEGIRAKY